MTIELAVLISVVSVCASVFFGLKSAKRNDTQDTSTQTALLTRMEVKIDILNDSVEEIKAELKEHRRELGEHGERIAKVESSAKQAHKRLDDIEAVLKKMQA